MKKYTAHIPTEQYGFIEVEIESDNPEDITEEYKEVRKSVHPPQEGLSPKEWREALDRYLVKGDMEADKYACMSKEQRSVIQEIKKSIKRRK